ncbi:MAG TPA: prolipoprotein diacylglyceryl transferase family protein, partial [bacterium]|nr:prolipoprotein diacylglyceryl transferase family protein [bacterium]
LSYLMLYAVIRTVIELFRGDSDRGVYFNNTISTAQIMSFLFFCGCLAIYIYLWKRKPLAAPASPEAPAS